MERAPAGGGPTSFQIQGALFHTTGLLREAPGQRPVFAQTYFYHPQAAANHRFLSNDCLDLDVLTQLSAYIYKQNPLITLYKTARERMEPGRTVCC